MAIFSTCEQATRECVERQRFSVAHLHNEERTMELHIHNCYEVYYSISGGKQFLIDNKFYSVSPGDLFIINQFESHKLSDIDSNSHERIVLSFHPNYVKALCTENTNLDECFSNHPADFHHKISLSKESQKRFLYLVDKIAKAEGYGSDVLQQAAILELLVMLNRLSTCNATDDTAPNYQINPQVNEILIYINRNLSQPLTVQSLAEHFYVSPSYLCRIFKKATGTTVGKHITARRINVARVLLSEGCSVTEAYERSGFSDYSSFFKTFSRIVGMSPKKYATLCQTI